MRFNIAYTDYKKQRISNHSINYKFKNEVKLNDYKHNIDHHININNMNRAYEIDYNMIEYTDTNGILNYRFDLIHQHVTKKSRKLDKILDKICNIFFIYVNKMDIIQIDDKVNIGIDENKLSAFDDIVVPDLNITMNIYDRFSVTNIIDKIIT